MNAVLNWYDRAVFAQVCLQLRCSSFAGRLFLELNVRLVQLYWDIFTLVLLPKAGDRIYLGENSKER